MAENVIGWRAGTPITRPSDLDPGSFGILLVSSPEDYREEESRNLGGYSGGKEVDDVLNGVSAR
jgi:hypothetical protein